MFAKYEERGSILVTGNDSLCVCNPTDRLPEWLRRSLRAYEIRIEMNNLFLLQLISEKCIKYMELIQYAFDQTVGTAHFTQQDILDFVLSQQAILQENRC
jgi:hypothetical protein